MSELELIARSVVYALCAVAMLAGAFWWGWDQRTKLALKLEHFRLTNTQWVAYDDSMKKGEKPSKLEAVYGFAEHERSGR